MADLQIESIEREEWLQLAAQFRDHNYRQSWNYGLLLAKRRRATSQHVKILRAGGVLGLADVRIKRAPLLGGIAYISGGPLVRKGAADDLSRLGDCLDALRHHFVDRAGLILRIQGTLGDRAWNQHATECFAAKGFVPACQGHPYRTLMVDLRPSLADIRAALAQKWRNCLNKAERGNSVPRTSADIEDFDRFTALFDPFVGRKQFTVDLGADFYHQVQSQASSAESLTLMLLETDGVLRAGHMSSMLGDTCVYLLGATSDAALKTNAAYLLQWHVIKMARQRGLSWYDLGGIDPQENPGVYHFKCGMGGCEMIAPGPFEFSPNSLRAHLILAAESAYRRLRQTRPAKVAKPTARAHSTKDAAPQKPEQGQQSRGEGACVP